MCFEDDEPCKDTQISHGNISKCRGQVTEPAMYNVTPHMRHGTTKMITEKPREKEADKERLRELAAFNTSNVKPVACGISVYMRMQQRISRRDLHRYVVPHDQR